MPVRRTVTSLPTGPDAAAGSYSTLPFDQRQVVNATAYRAWVLTDAGQRFDRADYLEDARLNLNFVLESQAEDGSWLYAMNEAKSFIDHFHTCFNLKNLYKIHRLRSDPRVEQAIRRGYGYYREQLIDEAGNPKSFAVEPRLQVTKLEMYNFAEGITLGALLGDLVPEALGVSETMADRLIHEHQLPDGHFVTRVFRGGLRHKFPFLRWPQGQLFYALTNLWKVSAEKLKSSNGSPRSAGVPPGPPCSGHGLERGAPATDLAGGLTNGA